jgi:hypothetical protein
MHINVTETTPVARETEADFIVPLFVDVVAEGVFDGATEEDQLDDEAGSEFVVGRVWAERLDWLYAEECGHEVLPICDVSGPWMQVLETVSKDGGRTFRKDLNLESLITDIVFVHEILLHPEITDRIAVLDAILRGLTSDNSLILMHYEQSEAHHLEDWECNDLGFKKIARSNLLIKDNHYRYAFGDQHPAGRSVKLQATIEHENWLIENWRELITDHPSL